MEDFNEPQEKVTLWAEVMKYFSMKGFLTDKRDITKRINDGISFRGPNLWVLVFAIFTASLGLNVNSTAVIIGAMLISPLMGPIIGMGYAVGTNDMDLLKRSLKNYAVATLISLLTATVYFFLTPYHGAQSELLARTSPTIYDVLIALCGGAAGIVALSAKDRGNILPGVAIATALMPPLCTAGFGIASLSLKYFLGAFYLYFINTVFIALATYIGVRAMKFRRVANFEDKAYRRVKRTLMTLVLATMIPAAIMTVKIIHDSIFNSQVEMFLNNEMKYAGSQIISHKTDYANKTLTLASVGREIPESQIIAAQEKLPRYGLKDYSLNVIQGTLSDSLMALQGTLSEMTASKEELKTTISHQSQEIAELKESLGKYKNMETLTKQAVLEIRALYPQIQSLSMSRAIESGADTNDIRSYLNVVAHIEPKSILFPDDLERIKTWLKTRTGYDDMNLIVSTAEESSDSKE